MVGIFIIGVASAVMALCVVLAIRNLLVIRYLLSVLNRVREAAEMDIDAGRDWQWRFDAFEMVSQCEMVICFWRRLDSFYPDKSFCEFLR